MLAVFLLSLLLLIMVLAAIAFLTLFERHLLGINQNRLGPNKSSVLGVVQPVLDGLKLLTKSKMNLKMSFVNMYLVIPVIGFVIMFLEWSVLPFHFSFFTFKMAFLLFAVCIGSFVYVTMLVGIFSSSKYSMLGSIRSSAQVISYEVCFMIYLFGLLTLESSMVMEGKWSLMKVIVILPWLVGVLSEVHRTPFDFAEGESELVSGFNTEYGSFGFTLLFLSEYGSLLFFSVITSMLFFDSSTFWFLSTLFSLTVIRSYLPRFRYDKLMNIFWFMFLPISLFYLWLLIFV